MAEYDWWGGDDEYGVMDDSDRLSDILFYENSGTWDSHAQDLFTEYMFNDNENAYNELIDYLWFEYDIDFEQVFDWSDFREWYG